MDDIENRLNNGGDGVNRDGEGTKCFQASSPSLFCEIWGMFNESEPNQAEQGAYVNNRGDGRTKILFRAGLRSIQAKYESMLDKREPNRGLWKITAVCAKVCIAGTFAKAAVLLYVGMNMKLPMLIVVGEVASIWGLFACVCSTILWESNTRGIYGLAKSGVLATLVASSIMGSVSFHGIFTWLVPLLVVCFTALFIWKC